jgi:uncharacterized protein (TIGR04255 family)
MCNVRELIDHVVPERPRLENAPLKAVVCQARFPRQLSLGDDEVRPIRRVLSDRYSLVADAALAPGRRRALRFSDADGNWVATVGPESISLETTEYVGMRDLLARWVELICATAEVFELTALTRLGLRYINELDWPQARREDLSGWVREELLSPFVSQPDTEGLQRFVSKAQFRRPDGSSCNVRHGITPNEDDPDGMVFLLDLDCYRWDAVELDPADQVRSLANLNESAYGFFEWAFANRVLERFGPALPGGSGAWVKSGGEPRYWKGVLDYLAPDALQVDCTATADLGFGHLLFAPPDQATDFSPAEGGDPISSAEPLSVVLRRIRESIDIPVVDLARMVGLRRRQFYNLLDGNPTTTQTEMRIRRLAAALERLAQATGDGPAALRAAVLTPVGQDATNLFEVAVEGDEGSLARTVEALLAQIAEFGVRRTRRAIPRPASPTAAERRRKRAREALADRPGHEPAREGDDDGRK